MQKRLLMITFTLLFTLVLCGAVSAENSTENLTQNDTLNQTLPDPIIEHNGANTTSWAIIQDAIDHAQSGDTIWIETGTYATTNDYTNPALVYVTKSLTFRGYGGTVTINGNDLFRCIWVNSGVTANFYDITITNGRSWNPQYLDGAGIFNEGGTVNLYNCTLEDNDGFWSGGAIYNNQGAVKLENSTIKNNDVSTKGGAIYNNHGAVDIIGNSTISSNSARNGGGIYNDHGTVTIQNSNVNSNSVYDTGENNGGAIYNDGGTVSISGCMMWSNNADDNGGAIYNTGTTTINDTNIYSNTAFSGGAIYNTDIGTIIITGSSLYSNLAGNGTDGNPGGNGGAIYNKGTSTITNCEIHDNQAGNGGNGILGGNGGSGGNGGAIYTSVGTMTITGGSIYNNHAGNGGSGSVLLFSGGNGGSGGSGGAIYTTATTTITGTKIYSNIAGNGGNGANGADGLGHLIPGYSGGNGGSGGDGGAIYNTGALNIYSTEIYSNIAGNGGTAGNGGNGIRGTLTHCNGGNGGAGGAGGNAGGIYNSNYLMITTSTVNSNRSGNGGTGGNGGKGSDRYSSWPVTIPSGSGGNGGNGGLSGFGAGIYNTGSYLEVTSNNLTDNFIGTPGNGGAAGSKGSGDGGTNGNAGVAGSSGDGGAFYSTVNALNSQGLHFNRILNNSAHDVVAASGASVSAENNWWGSNSNPGSRISGNVNYSPWIMLRIFANPGTIHYLSTSDITSNLIWNTIDGTNPYQQPTGGHIPDGITVDFGIQTGPGNINPFSSTTSAGTSHTTYLGNGIGIATIYTQVDNERQTVNVTVEKANSSISVNPSSGVYKGSTVLSATLRDEYGNPIAGEIVTFTVDSWSATGTTDGSGIASVTYNPITLNPTGSPYTITAVFAGNGYYNGITGTNLLTVSKANSTLDVNSSSGVYKGSTVLSATLRDQYGDPIAGVIVNFYVNGSLVGSGTTNGSGVASVTYSPINLNPTGSPYAITAIFAGNDYYNGQTGSNQLTVFKANTTITVNNITGNNGKTVNLIATLTDSYGDPLNNCNVTFTVNGIDAGSVLTDANGVATISYLIGLVGGTYTIQASFEGDNYYNASNGTGTLKVPQADLYIKSWASKTNPYVGEIITITFKVGNYGPDTAENVVFTLQIPEGMEFVDVSVDGGVNPTYDPVTRTLTWILGDVEVGDPTALVSVKVLRAGSFIFAPGLSTDTYDPNLGSSIQNVIVNAQNVPESNVVNAQTIGMQNTGIPLAGLVLAILAVFAGLVMPKRK